MFELLFKYPAAVFARGKLVFLVGWPGWVLALLAVAFAAALAFPFWRMRHRQQGLDARRSAALWALQAAFIAVLLLMLWQPALSVSTLRPLQNIVAVVVDDSRSMAMRDGSGSRRDEAVRVLDSGLLDRLGQRFQVRLYRVSAKLERIKSPDRLNAAGTSTHLGTALKQVADEAASLPVGAVLLLSDGADNSGGIDLATMNALRQQHLPIHTVGFGRERLEHDIEVTSVDIPARALADSRVAIQVGVRQYGYSDRRAQLKVTNGSSVLASRSIDLKKEGAVENVGIVANVGGAGAKTLRVSIEPLGGEENPANNAVNRLITVEDRKPRILYVEGEPRWEFKFIRRAAEEDKELELVSMLRTTQNKIYRQGVKDAAELADGFPSKVEDVFSYDGLIIGGVEANYFTPAQQELIRQFADRRGGGVLFLGGRFGLAEGGWAGSDAAAMLPVVLPNRKDTFRRDPANTDLASAGMESIICRLEDDPARNAERWRRMPYLANYQDPGTPKSGATVLLEMTPVNGRRMPLLITENYGRGRTALFATAGSWRWQMAQPLADKTHEMFWQQLLRWLVAGTTGPVVVSTDHTVYTDETHIKLSASIRDKTYAPATDATVNAHVIGPNGFSEDVQLRPDPLVPGNYAAETDASRPGSYVTEVTAKRGADEVGRDVVSFLREDGVAENFHTEQNRELLEKLSSQTGGRYYGASQTSRIPDEISLSEAGISTHETRELWNMPLLFLFALILKSSEWALRRRWGAV